MTITGPSGTTAQDQADTPFPSPRVSVVIPALNEARNLEHVFAALPGGLHEVILVDGHSVDGTPVPRFVEALTSGADFAKGSRFAPGAGSSDITPLRRLGNRVLGLMVNAMRGSRYSDLCYGHNAAWARHVPSFGLRAGARERLWGDGFEIETMLNLRAAAAGLAVTEVPSFEHARVHGTSNLNTFRDGRRALRTIVTEWRRPARLRPVPSC